MPHVSTTSNVVRIIDVKEVLDDVDFKAVDLNEHTRDMRRRVRKDNSVTHLGI